MIKVFDSQKVFKQSEKKKETLGFARTPLKMRGNRSFVWKSISKVIHILRGNMCQSIGDGKNVQIGLDSWVPSATQYYPRINGMLGDKKC